jgi:hypothetical protein
MPVVERTVFRINEPNVVFEAFDDEVVVIHLASGAYHSLRGTAAQVMQQLAAGASSSSDIASHLSELYDAPPTSIEQDLAGFLSGLADASIIVAARNGGTSATSQTIKSSGHRAPYQPPVMESFHDLEQLVLLDPVHDVSAAGWPKPREAADAELLLQRCRIAGPSIIFERFDTETVAMDMGTGTFHSLKGAAEAIFLLLRQEPTTWEIRDALTDHYGIAPTALESDLAAYLDELEGSRLIVREPIADAPPSRGLKLEPADPSAEYLRPAMESFQHTSMDSPSLHPSFHEAASDPFLRLPYVVRSNDLLYSSASKEIVVADRLQGNYLKLNGPASDVFRMLLDGSDIDTMARALQARYDAQPGSLRVPLMVLLAQLKMLGVVKPGSTPAVYQEAESDPRLPFHGFEVAAYADLVNSLQPFNPGAPEPVPARLTGVRRALQVLKEDFEEAGRVAGVEESFYCIGGRSIRILGTRGGHIADLTRAFQHLRVEHRRPDLTIHIWHGGIASRDPLLEMSLSQLHDHWQRHCGPRGEMLHLHTLPVSALYHPGPDALSVVDTEAGEGFYLCRTPDPLPSWEYGSPFRNIFHPWFASIGLQYTHAGAVGGPRGGVLLAGKGGSGKSTTAMLCAAAGMSYASDDYCLTDAETRQAFSLYNTAKLTGHDDLNRIPEARGHSFNRDGFEHGGTEKATYTLSDIWPGRLVTSLPLQAIVLPVVTGQAMSRLEPCSAGEAQLALTPSTVGQLHVAGNDDCDRLARLAMQLPAFRLHLGTELDRIPELLRQFTG